MRGAGAASSSARNPGIRVEVQQIPWTAAHEKLLTALRRRRDARRRAARQHLDRRVRGARRARAARRARRRVADRRAAPTTSPASGTRNVVDGATYGVPWYVDTRVLFYRTRPPRARPATPAPPRRGPSGATRCARSSARGGAGRYAHPPADRRVGAAGDPRRCRTARRCSRDGGTRGALPRAARSAAAFDVLPRALPRRASRRRSSNSADREPLPGVRARATSRCSSPARGTSASSAPRCPPSCRTTGRRRRCRRPTARRPGRLARRRREPRRSSARSTQPGRGVAARSSSSRGRRSRSRFYELTGDLPARRAAWQRPGARRATAQARAFRAQLERVRADAARCPSGSRSRRSVARARRAGGPRRRPAADAALAGARRATSTGSSRSGAGCSTRASRGERERPLSAPATRGRARRAPRWLFVAPGARRSSRVFFVAAGRRRAAPAQLHRLRHLRDRRPATTRASSASSNYAGLLARPALLEGARATRSTSSLVGGPLSVARVARRGAAARTRGWRASRGFFRTVYFAPVVTTLVAVAIVWRYLYHPRYGLLNHAARRSSASRRSTGSAIRAGRCRRSSCSRSGRTSATTWSSSSPGCRASPRSSTRRRALDGAGAVAAVPPRHAADARADVPLRRRDHDRSATSSSSPSRT